MRGCVSHPWKLCMRKGGIFLLSPCLESIPAEFPVKMKLLEALKNRARLLKVELHALWLATRDPRTHASARWLIVCVIVYALSPIDLIPDFIPVIGYLDELILLPLGIALALRMIPPEVMTECRERVWIEPLRIPGKWKAASAAGVFLTWLFAMAMIVWAFQQ